MGQWSLELSNVIMRRLTPAKPDQLLSPEEMVALSPRIERLDTYAIVVAILSILIFAVIFTFLLNAVDLAVHDQASEPIYDDRNGLMWTATGLALGFIFGYLPTRLYIRWWMRGDVGMYDRYQATKSGIDQQRALIIVSLAWAAAGVFFGLLAWNYGTTIDEQGIRFKPGLLTVYQYRYNEVVEICLYDKVDAPIGILDDPNLQVAFKTGQPLRLRNNAKSRKKPLVAIAEYISQRSGIGIERKEIRP